MKLIPDSYHIVIMRSSGGGAPITVPSRWVKRLWVSFLVLVALLIVLSLALGFTVHSLNQRQAQLKARQAEIAKLYINLAHQNEELISLKKLVPPASALYLASLDKAPAQPLAAAPAQTAAKIQPPAKPAAALTAAKPAPQVKPLPTPAKLVQTAVPVRPVAAQLKPLPPAAATPPAKLQTPTISAPQPKPRPTNELVKITDLKRAGDQLSLRLKCASGEIASGFLVAVFGAGGNYASYPSVALKGASPTQGRQGLDFNVRNFRLISFTVPLDNWSRLTFFIYDRQGHLKQQLHFSRTQVKQ